MDRSSSKSLRVRLEAITHLGIRFVAARITVDLKKAWPGWSNRRVAGEINGLAFRNTLFPVAGSTEHLLIVNRKLQAAAGVRAGDMASLRIEPDLAAKSHTVPPELASILRGEPALRRWFESLSHSMQKGFSQFVDQAKGKDVRRRRAERMAESLMLAMEGEQETPPLLRAEFERRPRAHAGWLAMTSIQRRNHLVGIFYQQTVAGRQKRAAMVIEACLRIAERKSSR